MRKFSSSRIACSVVFCMAVAIAATAQTYTDLYNFGPDGSNNPRWSGILAQGRDGELYSTTPDTFGDSSGHAFKITPAGVFTDLHHFTQAEGALTTSGLTLADDGTFYGTANIGGKFNYGTVFRMTAEGTVTPLYSFTNGADGSIPVSPPVEDFYGDFYGTTSACAGVNGPGCSAPIGNGSVYEITSTGVFKILHTFTGTDGANPMDPLVHATDDNFYGTTSEGGTNGDGTIFRISPSGHFEVLFNFDNASGTHPIAQLIQASDGNFYGDTTAGGSSGGGTVFRITPDGKLTVLHNFTFGSDGGNPVGGLTQATDGNLYGTNVLGPEVLFRISLEGTFDTLFDFSSDQGTSPQATMVQRTNGTLYGTASVGGTNGVGTFFSFNVGLGAFVSLLRNSGLVGQPEQILGQGFTGTTGVSFNGTAVKFSVKSDTYLTATVPAGATTGFVTVTTSGGMLTSNKTFRVVPQITSFTPTSGPVGTSVVITGESFIGVINVHFGSVKVTNFTLDSDTQITAIVPTGAETGKISACTPGGSAESGTSFTLTP